MGDLGTAKSLCGENIQMRDINFTLQKHIGSLRECATALGAERCTLCNYPFEDNSLTDLQGVDLCNFKKAQEGNFELDSPRRRKRKQQNVNIHRVSSKTPYSKQTVLNQDNKEVVKVQQCPQEAVALEQIISKVGDEAIGSLVCDSLQDSKRCKRKIETSSTHKLDNDKSTVADCALNDSLVLEFDAQVSAATALGFQHTSCSVAKQKGRTGTCYGKNAGEKKPTSTCDEAVGTTITASAVSRIELGSVMSMTLKNSEEIVNVAPSLALRSCGLVNEFRTDLPNGYENSGKVVPNVKEVSSMDQTENQKLRKALDIMQSHLNILLSFAEKGSRDCGHCQSIQDEIKKFVLNCGDISSGQGSAGKVAIGTQNSACEEAQDWGSPVGSCTNEKTAVNNGDCKRQTASVLCAQQMESTLPWKEKVSELHEDIEEPECHICIELASSPSEDLDTEQMKHSQDVSLESEKNDSIRCTLASGKECESENLRMCLEEKKTNAPGGLTHAEFGKRVDSFRAGVEDEDECADLSDKNSKESGWNSALTGNRSHHGDLMNEPEDNGYIDLKCGCTSPKYGDTAGILRLHQNGKVEIQCQCSLGCMKGKPMSPANFERHAGRGASKKWKETVWIVLGDQKVQFSKVKGLNDFVHRYKESSQGRLHQPAPAKLPYHRDEFVQCKKCSKRRRFRRKTKEECWFFHEASMNSEWECSHYPSESVLSCQDDEEREARQANRGCIRSRSCEGCLQCVCLGCFTCRFEDCPCRLCVEYIANNK